jgi:hypothetical protein
MILQQFVPDKKGGKIIRKTKEEGDREEIAR